MTIKGGRGTKDVSVAIDEQKKKLDGRRKKK